LLLFENFGLLENTFFFPYTPLLDLQSTSCSRVSARVIRITIKYAIKIFSSSGLIRVGYSAQRKEIHTHCIVIIKSKESYMTPTAEFLGKNRFKLSYILISVIVFAVSLCIYSSLTQPINDQDFTWDDTEKNNLEKQITDDSTLVFATVVKMSR
jgi:hypothetical protein